jgi:CheY-like chemotaxis protein
MPKGGTVTVATGLSDGFVDISVADTGTGMSEETKRRLFEPFFTTKKSRGTGIGMSVSYALVTKFGGRILVESKMGAGTTVRILLPPALFARQAEPHVAETARTRAPKKPAKSRRILVVDDEENICEILHEYLSLGGHEVMTASIGEDGLRLLEHHTFDIVITDLNMPRVSGWEIARRVKHKSPSTLTIMLTGWGTNIEELNSREPVVDRLLFKPVNFPRLSAIIAEAADK